MFNLLNLDPLEFEKFCLDYMEQNLGKKFKRFGPGKDDGIDLISIDGEIICQCKRYKDSSKLESICKKEYSKLKSLSFRSYYLLTTAELNETISKKIFLIFNDYMPDYTHIIGKNDIDDFLSDDKNICVLKKNHKLWLTSSKMLDLYFNRYTEAESKMIIKEFETLANYFVDTKPYYDAINTINDNNIVLLIGEPGIGKSITSKMLIRYLIAENKDYKLRSVSNNDLSKLIESIQQNDESEIIFLDDFLGQTCLEISDYLIKDLKLLFSLTKIYNNKKIILNSRITILNKAKNEKIEFEKLLAEFGIKECLIDVLSITKIDRARILCNLFYHNGLPDCSFNDIKENKKYNNIICHNSFNTRIIEMCMIRAKKNKIDNLYEYIMESLNNPKDVWKDEFQKIEFCDIVLMYQLFTLGNSYIPIDSLKLSVQHYLEKTKYSIENYNFFDSINRLNNSLIRIVILGRKKYVTVFNPSINDYIQNYLLNNDSEMRKIFFYSLYIEQIDKIINLNSTLKNEQFEIPFENLIAYNTYNSYMSDKYLDKKKKISFILKYNYCNNKISTYVQDFYNYDIGSNYLIQLSLEDSIRDFYKINDILKNFELCSNLFCNSDYTYLKEILDYYSINKYELNKVMESFADVLNTQMKSYLITYGEEKVNDLLFDNSSNNYIIEDSNIIINDEYIQIIYEKTKEHIIDKYESLLDDLDYLGFNSENLYVDCEEIMDNVYVESIIEDDIKNIIEEENSPKVENDYSSMEQSSLITVDDIFNREYLKL